MALARDRTILGSLSIITLISITLLLLRPPVNIDASSKDYLNLCATTISGFHITILFSWFAFGGAIAISISVLILILVLWAILRSNIYGCYIYILTFFLANLMGWGFSKIKERIEGGYILKFEKLDEEMNLLANNISVKKNEIKSLEEKLQRYSILKDVAVDFSTALSLDDINHLIIEKALNTLGKKGRVLLFLVDIERQELILSASGGHHGTLRVKTKKGDVFDYWVLRHRTSLMVEDVTKDFRFPTNAADEAKEYFLSLIATPLVSENKVIGILRMDSIKEFTYTQEDLRLLDIVADLGAVAIQNSYLYSKTQELAIRDGLTGLYLRRYFMERLQQEVMRAARKKDSLSLLMLDIDHFKAYNDRFGHMSGDLVLKHLARIISSVVKEGDIVSRYGGEEMVLLLYGADRNRALKTAEAIRSEIEENPLMLRRERAAVTASIGVSSYPEDATLEEELVRVADERLYKAKAQGRNRVCSGA